MKKDEFKCLKYVIGAFYHLGNATIVFSNTDENNLIKQLKSAIPNTNPSEFPDFLSEDVLLEHFSITASKENRKGSSFKVKESIVNNKIQNETNKFQETVEKLPITSNVVRVKNIKNIYTDFSYDNFLKSLNKNLAQHIESLKKYNNNDRKVIFLIELQDAPLHICRNGIFLRFYELNRDKNALEILKVYIDLIDIVIFRASDRIEMIDISKFDSLYENSAIEKDIRGGRLITINSLINIDMFN